MADIHRSSDGGLDVCNPYALEPADSVNSEFFAPVGNTLITSRETEDLVRTCYLPSVRQHLTAFDADNTAAQQPTNVLPELPCRLCFTDHGYYGELLCASGVYFRYLEIPSSSKCTQSITRIIPIRRSHAIWPRCPPGF